MALVGECKGSFGRCCGYGNAFWCRYVVGRASRSCLYANTLHWFVHMCDMTHSYVRHDWCISFFLAWLANDQLNHWTKRVLDMRDTCESHATHHAGHTWIRCIDSFICATWLIRMCDMTHLCQTYYVSRYVARHKRHLCVRVWEYGWVMSHIWMSLSGTC